MCMLNILPTRREILFYFLSKKIKYKRISKTYEQKPYKKRIHSLISTTCWYSKLDKFNHSNKQFNPNNNNKVYYIIIQIIEKDCNKNA